MFSVHRMSTKGKSPARNRTLWRMAMNFEFAGLHYPSPSLFINLEGMLEACSMRVHGILSSRANLERAWVTTDYPH